tara:strand:+ start:101 stop:484 length:384 start_codon:yes stop_codon:yes gene_type:complete
MKKENEIAKSMKAISLLKLELDQLKERIDDFLDSENYHIDNNFIGHGSLFPDPNLQGNLTHDNFIANDEVLFVNNNGQKKHGYISEITDSWMEIVELDIYDNPTSIIHRYQNHILPTFLRKVISNAN